MKIAQMLQGSEAVKMYRKGIDVLHNDQRRYEIIHEQAQAQLRQRQRASAYASIAEEYMTEPLCDLPEAEQTCEHSFAEALNIDPDNIDAKQGLA